MKPSEETFYGIIKKGLKLKEVNADDEFRDYNEWDSLMFIALVSLLQAECGFELTPEVFDEIDTWQDLYQAIND